MKRILFLVTAILFAWPAHAADMSYKGSVDVDIVHSMGPVKDKSDDYMDHYVSPHFMLMVSEGDFSFNTHFMSQMKFGSHMQGYADGGMFEDYASRLYVHESYFKWMTGGFKFKVGRFSMEKAGGMLFAKMKEKHPLSYDGLMIGYMHDMVHVGLSYLIDGGHGVMHRVGEDYRMNAETDNHHKMVFSAKVKAHEAVNVSLDYVMDMADVKTYADVSGTMTEMLNKKDAADIYVGVHGDYMGVSYRGIYGMQGGDISTTVGETVTEVKAAGTVMDFDLAYSFEDRANFSVRYHSSSGDEAEGDFETFLNPYASDAMDMVDFFEVGNLSAIKAAVDFNVMDGVNVGFVYGQYGKVSAAADVNYGFVGRAMDLEALEVDGSTETMLGVEMAVSLKKMYSDNFSTSFMVSNYTLDKVFVDVDAVRTVMLGFDYMF